MLRQPKQPELHLLCGQANSCGHRPLLRRVVTQILAGRGLAKVSVAIDPAPFRGVLPLPISALKSGSPVLHNPANRNRAVPLTYAQGRSFVARLSEGRRRDG